MLLVLLGLVMTTAPSFSAAPATYELPLGLGRYNCDNTGPLDKYKRDIEKAIDAARAERKKLVFQIDLTILRSRDAMEAIARAMSDGSTYDELRFRRLYWRYKDDDRRDGEKITLLDYNIKSLEGLRNQADTNYATSCGLWEGSWRIVGEIDQPIFFRDTVQARFTFNITVDGEITGNGTATIATDSGDRRAQGSCPDFSVSRTPATFWIGISGRRVGQEFKLSLQAPGSATQKRVACNKTTEFADSRLGYAAAVTALTFTIPAGEGERRTTETSLSAIHKLRSELEIHKRRR